MSKITMGKRIEWERFLKEKEAALEEKAANMAAWEGNLAVWEANLKERETALFATAVAQSATAAVQEATVKELKRTWDDTDDKEEGSVDSTNVVDDTHNPQWQRSEVPCSLLPDAFFGHPLAIDGSAPAEKDCREKLVTTLRGQVSGGVTLCGSSVHIRTTIQ